MDKKELTIVGFLTFLLAFMDITGFPSVLFVNISILGIEPFYWVLMVNFIIICLIAFLVLKYFCKNFKLGINKNGLIDGFKKYGLAGIVAGLISGIAFYIGLKPFDFRPTVWKVLIEGVIYYIGLSIVEELYVRGLLLNLIEKVFYKKANKTFIAVVLSSIIFGFGHIFGLIGQSGFVIISKVIFTIGMGIYFGAIYKNSGNLWLPIILHFIIDVCALPYCFTTVKAYPNVSLLIIVPVYVLLGAYGILILNNKFKIKEKENGVT